MATLRTHRLGVLNLAAFQLGQFFVQVQVIQVQLFGCPLLLADCPCCLGRCLRGWLKGRRWFHSGGGRVGALLE